MSWVKFTERKPNVGDKLITRFPGYDKKGVSFETHEKWNSEYLKICYPDGTGHISHWWDGEFDLDKAVEAWCTE